MKIGIVSHEFEPFPGGGIATYHNAAARIMAAAGHEVHFVTNSASHGSVVPAHAAPVHRDGNLTVHRLRLFDEGRKIAADSEMFGLRLGGWRDPAGSWAADASNMAALQVAAYVRELHARIGLDVIESPEFFAEAYYMIRARRSGREREFPPICVHGHTSSRQAYRTNSHFWELGYYPHRAMMAREEYCLQHADALLTPSQSLLSIYEQTFGKNLPRVRAVVPYFLDLPRANDRHRLPPALAGGFPFLLCVGRLEPRKGSDLAVRAFAEIGRAHPQLRLVFLGREMWHHGEHFDDVLRTWLPPELRERVVRTGNVPREQVLACMAAAVAFLHPAPWDNYPCATLEAMSVGAVCIVSDKGGQAEMLEPGVSGLLHRSEDVTDLVGVIRSVLDRAIDLDSMRAAARTRAAKVTDQRRLLSDRQKMWDEMLAGNHVGGVRHRPRATSTTDDSLPVPGSGVVVIDAGGTALDRFEHTRDRLQGSLRCGAGWRVVVQVDPGVEVDLPPDWQLSTTIAAMPWADAAPSAFVVWLVAGVELDPGRLVELVNLVQSNGGSGGAFAWLRFDSSEVFPWAPDFGSHEVLAKGRPLPPAFAVRAAALSGCRSLSGLGLTSVRLAALLAFAVSRKGAWLRHTAGTVGRFHGELPVVTDEVQCRALGFLDALGVVPPSVVLLGGAQAGSSPAPVATGPTLPRWMPSPVEAGVADVVASASARGQVVTEFASLHAALSEAGAAVVWRLGADNWFDLVRAARVCSEVNAHMTIEVATEGAPLSELPEADLVAVYQCVRDWWPLLTGASRPSSLHDEEYNNLAGQLRNLVSWRADRTLQASVDGARALAFPSIGHELLVDDGEALRLFRSFLAATDSVAFSMFLDGLAARVDLGELAAGHAWVRLLLLHRSWTTWDAKVHSILHAIYAPEPGRRACVAREKELCEASGLRWWWDSVWQRLGLERAFGRVAPFAVPPVTRASVADHDAQVTVLIPSFKHEAYVADAIRSVLAQTLRGISVLVVDDRSPDGTVAAARSVDDPRVEVLENPANKGLGNSILDALQMVTTPYVAILNSDDLYHPRRLEVCVEALTADSTVDLVTTGLDLVDRDGGALDSATVAAWHDGRNVRDWVHWYERVRPTQSQPFDAFRELLRRNFLVTSSNVVCRTEWLMRQDATLTGLKYCLDWQLFLTAALRGRIRYVSEPLLAYRLHPSNTVWFDKSARWAYTLEVSRVAAGAMRARRQLYSDRSEEAPVEVLRDLVLGMRGNTEVDWQGMLANELVGGALLEACSRRAGDVPDLLRELLAGSPAATSESRRSHALESKARAQLDEMHVLRSRHRWVTERLATTVSEAQGLRQALAAATAEVRDSKQSLALIQRDAAQAEQLASKLQSAERRLVDLATEGAALQAGLAEARQRIGGLERENAEMGSAAADLRSDLVKLQSLVADQLHDLTVLRRSLAEAEERERELSGRCGELNREVAALRALEVSLRSERAILQQESAAVVRALAESRQVRAADLRRLNRAWDDGAAIRSSIAVQLAEAAVARDRDEAATWSLRGFRIRPGAGTRSLLRRLAKGLRKLRAGVIAGPGVDLREPVHLLHVAEPGSDPTTLTATAAFAGYRRLRLLTTDANEVMPRLDAGTAVVVCFPEAGQHLLVRGARRVGLDPGRLTGRLQALAAAGTRDPRMLAAEVAHLADRVVARYRAGFVTSGSLSWQAAMGQVARLAGRPWIAVVDRIDDSELAPSLGVVADLATADLVVVRSRPLFERLVVAGLAPAKVAVDHIVPEEGVFDGKACDPSLTIAFGEFESPWMWDYCLSGFAMAAPSGHRLRVVGVLDPNRPASRAAELVVRGLAKRWPQGITVDAVQWGRVDWRRTFAGPSPRALVWLPPGDRVAAASHPVVLAAIRAGVPVAPVDTPTAADLFGALGMETWIRRTGIHECAAVFETLTRDGGGVPFGGGLVREGLRTLLISPFGNAATERVAEVLRRLTAS